MPSVQVRLFRAWQRFLAALRGQLHAGWSGSLVQSSCAEAEVKASVRSKERIHCTAETADARGLRGYYFRIVPNIELLGHFHPNTKPPPGSKPDPNTRLHKGFSTSIEGVDLSESLRATGQSLQEAVQLFSAAMSSLLNASYPLPPAVVRDISPYAFHSLYIRLIATQHSSMTPKCVQGPTMRINPRPLPLLDSFSTLTSSALLLMARD